jgi:hypothetical protein
MQILDLLTMLMAATNAAEVASTLSTFESEAEGAGWAWLGNKDNNRGPVEVSVDPGRSLVERLTNGIDAVLEAEYIRHDGLPSVMSPRDAAATWLNVPHRGLSALSPGQRRQLADKVQITILPGDGKNARLVEVRDSGTGLTPDEMPTTILGLNEGNKMQKHHLVGTYGQGGSSTFAISPYAVIVSRGASGPDRVGFTVVKYQDLPPEQFKTGRYVYLVVNEQVPEVASPDYDFAIGTLIRHMGYDLSDYSSPLGPNSVYGLLNQVLFDPVMPVWLDASAIHNYRRVIKGSRNALNGAVDEGDERRRGPELAHNLPAFYVSLGDFGRVGFEYWVLERPSKENKRPSAAFVDPYKPIILSLHGQNHSELPVQIIRKEAELPYLGQRLICHVDCDALTPIAKRLLFSSSRESARRGVVLTAIRQELVRLLRSDDELMRLNNEARDAGLEERDESALMEIRQEVANLLRMQGLDIGQITGVMGGGTQRPTGRQPRTPRGPRRVPEPIRTNEPPNYIKIVWDEERPVTLYPGQRRYLRIETDANSNYHDPEFPDRSRLNLIVDGASLTLKGSTPLTGGRMRAILEAGDSATVGGAGTVRVELMRPGLEVLSDHRSLEIVEAPPVQPGQQQLTLPPFETRRVSPEDVRWQELGWPDDYEAIASSAEMEGGLLVIYYSTVFPKYAGRLTRYERRSGAMAASFTRRYEVWLASHSLIFHQDELNAQVAHDQEDAQVQGEQEPNAEVEEAHERQERVRMATIAALFASREVDMAASRGADSEIGV